MSDDRNQNDDDLSLDITDSESNAEASNTEVESKELNLGEESKDTKPTGQSERGKQVAAWAVKVLSGDASIDNLPKNQRWMKADIEKLLLKQGGQEATSEDVLDARLEQKLQEKEMTVRFKEKLAEIKSQRLSSYQKTMLEAEYKDLVASGVSKDKALEKAYRLAQAEDREEVAPIQRKRMELPHMGSYMGAPERDQEDFLKKPEKDRMELYKSIMNSGRPTRK